MPTMLSDESEPVNILYYGEGGTGKTTDLAHMAKLGKVWVANAESGFKARALRKFGIPIENIEIFPDPEAGEEITYESIEREWLRIREALAADPDAYAGTIWDSVTELYQALLLDITKKAYEKAIAQGKDRDPSFIALEDYGVMTQQMRTLTRRFRDLPCHFGMSALAKREQDSDGSVVYNPQVTAKLQNDLIGWVDVVCVKQVIQVEGVDEYRGIFKPTDKWRGKDRFNMLPKGIVDPTFDRILQYIDGDLTVETDPVMKEAKARATGKAEEPVPA